MVEIKTMLTYLKMKTMNHSLHIYFLNALLLLSLSLEGCSSSKSNTTRPAVNSSQQTNPEAEAQIVIDENYPASAYTDVMALKSLAEFPIGVEVEAGPEERSIFTLTERQDVIDHHFSGVVAGNIMKMSFLHPHENEFTFSDADTLVDYALSQGMEMHGHTLIWDHPLQLPDWISNFEGDWQVMLNNHVFQIVDHFKGRVHSWDVVNEAVIGGPEGYGYKDTIFYEALGKNYIENAFVTARSADPEVMLYYNDWALSHNDGKLDFTLAMINDFFARSIPIDGIGFQMHTWLNYPSKVDIKSAFAKAAATGLMIKISEMDLRGDNPNVSSGSNAQNYTSFTARLALRQKDRYKEIIEAYLEAVPKAQRGGIYFWGLSEQDSWLQYIPGNKEWPLLFRNDFTVKPAFYGVVEALSGQ
jgi:endo-1,4-beta-xylanase